MAVEKVGNKLSKDRRLLNTKDFSPLKSQGKKAQSKHLLVIYITNGRPLSRLGIAVSTRIDKKATGRNTFKRRIREIFRLNIERFSIPLDILVIARNQATECDYATLEREFIGALRYQKVLR